MDGTAVTEMAAIAVEEARLSRAAAAGDGSAFAELYERYEPRTFNLACRITGSEAAAADVVQEAFLKAMRRQRRLADGELSFGPYLLSVTRNVSHDRAAGHPAPRSSEADPNATPSRDQEEISEANARLPERQREALALRGLEALSYEEIAAIMEVSPKTISQLVSRARINLRDELRGTALASVPPSAECGRAMPLIACREDGQLEPASAEATWLDDHLEACDRCRLGVEAMREAASSYRAWAPIAAPPSLLRETMAKAAEQAGADWSEVIETTMAARAQAASLPGMPLPYLGEPISDDSAWRRRRSPRRTVLAVGLAVLLLLAGLAAALTGKDRSSAPMVPAAGGGKPAGQPPRSDDGGKSAKAANSRGSAAQKKGKQQGTVADESLEEPSPTLTPISTQGASEEGSPSSPAARPNRPPEKAGVAPPRRTSAPKSTRRPNPTRTTTTTTPASPPATTLAPVAEPTLPVEESDVPPGHRREPPGKPADRPPR